jgi:hypothetical protein
MKKAFVAGALVLALAGCHKPPPEDTCRPPVLTATAPPGGYAAEKEAAMICVKKTAFNLAKAGGPVASIGAAAVAQCAATEKAIGKSGETLYDWQRDQLHESLLHAAQISAVQARAMGCGLPPGAPRDTL